MKRLSKETAEDREARRLTAYERGWVDSLRAYYNTASQPVADIYDYATGWHACAKYRWADPANNGRAPDPLYRPADPLAR